MLVNLKYVLDLAEKGGFCIPAFNVYNMESAMGVVKAAEETRAPIIMQVYPRLMKEEAGYYLSPVIIAAAKRASVPVCFHLDHGPSELETTRSLRYGATGIMLDGSTLIRTDIFRPCEILSHEHTEHRRLSRIFVILVGKMNSRVADCENQFTRKAAFMQRDNNFVPRRLIHLIDTCFGGNKVYFTSQIV